MLFISEYKLKPHLTKAEVKRLMDIFGKRGAVEGEIANYVRADGTGGFTIAENDDLTSAYVDVLLYSEYMTFTVTPVLSIDDAVVQFPPTSGSSRLYRHRSVHSVRLLRCR